MRTQELFLVVPPRPVVRQRVLLMNREQEEEQGQEQDINEYANECCKITFEIVRKRTTNFIIFPVFFIQLIVSLVS